MAELLLVPEADIDSSFFIQISRRGKETIGARQREERATKQVPEKMQVTVESRASVLLKPFETCRG